MSTLPIIFGSPKSKEFYHFLTLLKEWFWPKFQFCSLKFCQKTINFQKSVGSIRIFSVWWVVPLKIANISTAYPLHFVGQKTIKLIWCTIKVSQRSLTSSSSYPKKRLFRMNDSKKEPKKWGTQSAKCHVPIRKTLNICLLIKNRALQF